MKKRIVTGISVLIMLAILIRFITLLDLFGLDLPVIWKIGRFIPGWLLGIIGIIINICLSEGICEMRREIYLFRACATFCAVVAFFDLFILYVLSRI